MKSHFSKLLLACLLGLFVVTGCETTPPPAAKLAPAPKPFRFMVIADTHFGHKGMPAANRRLIEAVETYPGPTPTDLLIAGDLTENGTAEQWNEFRAHYGPLGLCKIPTKLCTGNHDRPDGLFAATPVLKGVAKLHGGLAYRWKREGVEFLSLDIHPKFISMQWMQKQLLDIGRDTPVVLLFHYNVTGRFSDFWTNTAERALYAKLLRDNRNIIAVFHGHYHKTTNITFEGVPHLSPGSPKYLRVFLVCDVTAKAIHVQAVQYGPTTKMQSTTTWETTIALPTRK